MSEHDADLNDEQEQGDSEGRIKFWNRKFLRGKESSILTSWYDQEIDSRNLQLYFNEILVRCYFQLQTKLSICLSAPVL